MRDPARQLADGLHLLRLPQGVFRLLALANDAGDAHFKLIVELSEFLLDLAAMVDVDQHAGKANRQAVAVQIDAPVRLDPMIEASMPAHAVLAAVGAAAGQRFLQSLRHALPISGVYRLHDLMQRQPGADTLGRQAEGTRESLVAYEDIGAHVPDPGADDRAGVERQLHPLGLGLRFRLARPYRLRRLAPQQRHRDVGGRARQQFAGRERLDQIIVGAGVKALDLGFLAGARRQHDDWQVAQLRAFAHRTQQTEAIELGHHHIADQQVGPGRLRTLQRGLPVGRGLDLVTLLDQHARDIAAQVGVVVGDEHAPAIDRGSGGDGGLAHRGRVEDGGVLVLARQPAQRLFDKRLGAPRRGDAGGGGFYAIGGKMGFAQGNFHREGRSLTDGALRADLAAELFDEFVDQREANPRTFEAAPLRALDAMKSVEEFWQFVRRYAGAGVAQLENRLAVALAQFNGDFALEGELEGVRHQIENDLLPHIGIDIDRLRQVLNVDDQA